VCVRKVYQRRGETDKVILISAKPQGNKCREDRRVLREMQAKGSVFHRGTGRVFIH